MNLHRSPPAHSPKARDPSFQPIGGQVWHAPCSTRVRRQSNESSMLAKTSLIAAVALFAASTPATAETLCGSRETVLKQLSSEYQEAPVGIGLASNGAVVELLTSASGTWTLLVTPPKGPTCLMGTGDGWQA